ncbi:MAG: ribosome maturation factor RimM [Thomasclavelia sp.]|jgi:16S rRNA processing protein RimM|nr:ribosome maturation factor RimM [Thomasclavelia sp.]
MKLIVVGKIIGTHALKGEVVVRSFSDFADDRFQKGKIVYLSKTDSKDIEMKIENVRVHKGNYLVLFEGYNNINDVEQYKGFNVLANQDDVQLEEGKHFYRDLIGLNVYENDNLIGVVNDIYDNGAQSVLIVTNGNDKKMIPYVKQFIKEVDIDNKRINVELIEGM